MSLHKKTLPVWAYLVIDLLLIALFTTSFYYGYFRVPRELESENIVIVNEESSEDTVLNESKEISEESVIEEAAIPTKFADKFSDTVISTDTEYRSKNISITLTKNVKGTGNDIITYFVADIYLTDIKCLQSGFAKDTYGIGYSEELIEMSNRLNALLTINGDYYGTASSGIIIRNGTVYRTKADSSDICVLYYDGSMRTFTAENFDISQAIDDKAYQAWCFGPALLGGAGESLTEFPTSRPITVKNPRTAIGYFEPGHYCFVVVDGRDKGYSSGMTMAELSSLMSELGCMTAYNLDGGQTSQMIMNKKTVNQPYNGGRRVSDCILIKELG